MTRSLSSSALSVVAVLIFVLTACKEPGSVEQFSRGDGNGQYEFELDMSDSLAVYDLTFFTTLQSDDSPSGFPITVYWHSPGGAEYVETVYYDLKGQGLKVPYRSGLEPVEYGRWTLTVYAQAAGLYGLGLICSKSSK